VFGAPTSLLYRSDLIRSVADFYPSASPHADTEACYEYLDRCDFGFVHQIISFERVHPGQTSEKSRLINYYIAERLRLLVKYGPRYLAPDAFRERLLDLLRNYHQFLAKNLLKGRDAEFWDYHRSQLRNMGYPVTNGALAAAMVAILADKILNPKQTVEGLLARRG
jgi:hypothetical protein